MSKQFSLVIPYIAQGFIFGAWISLATVDRTAFETVSVGVALPLGDLMAVSLIRYLTTSKRVFACASIGAISAVSVLVVTGPLLTIAAIGVGTISRAFFGLNRASTPVTKLVGLGPYAMVGGLLGVSAFSFFDEWSILLPLLSFVYFSQTTPGKGFAKKTSKHRRSWPITRSATLLALLVSLAAYGFIILSVAITEQEAGRVWIIPQMAAYVAGALLAGSINKRLPDTQYALGGLMLAAGISWLAALVVAGPGILVARFVSGAALFVVQGRIETTATTSGSGTQSDNLTAIVASFSVGAAFSGFWVGSAVEYSFTLAAMLSAAAGIATCVIILAFTLLSSRKIATSDRLS